MTNRQTTNEWWYNLCAPNRWPAAFNDTHSDKFLGLFWRISSNLPFVTMKPNHKIWLVLYASSVNIYLYGICECAFRSLYSTKQPFFFSKIEMQLIVRHCSWHRPNPISTLSCFTRNSKLHSQSVCIYSLPVEIRSLSFIFSLFFAIPFGFCLLVSFAFLPFFRYHVLHVKCVVEIWTFIFSWHFP